MSIADPPRVIGNYRILGPLGQGAMAQVFLAEFGGRKVALKVVRPEFARDDKFGQLMAREAMIGGLLRHPNIVETLEFGKADDRMFLALEFVDGKTVEDIIAAAQRAGRDALRPVRALDIMSQVLKGLSHAHTLRNEQGQILGIVHRDLKPGNIMVTTEGVAKVMDFGIAKAKVASAALTAAGQVRGTPIYMAPEQVTGQELDGRTDQFAAGTVLYELVTGKKLFLARNLIEIMRAVSFADTSKAEDELKAVHPKLAKVAGKMWARKPDERYSDCGQAARDLEDIRDDLKGRRRRKKKRTKEEASDDTAGGGGVLDLVAAFGLSGRKKKEAPAPPRRGFFSSAGTPSPTPQGASSPEAPQRPSAPSPASDDLFGAEFDTDEAPAPIESTLEVTSGPMPIVPRDVTGVRAQPRAEASDIFGDFEPDKPPSSLRAPAEPSLRESARPSAQGPAPAIETPAPVTPAQPSADRGPEMPPPPRPSIDSEQETMRLSVRDELRGFGRSDAARGAPLKGPPPVATSSDPDPVAPPATPHPRRLEQRPAWATGRAEEDAPPARRDGWLEGAAKRSPTFADTDEIATQDLESASDVGTLPEGRRLSGARAWQAPDEPAVPPSPESSPGPKPPSAAGVGPTRQMVVDPALKAALKNLSRAGEGGRKGQPPPKGAPPRFEPAPPTPPAARFEPEPPLAPPPRASEPLSNQVGPTRAMKVDDDLRAALAAVAKMGKKGADSPSASSPGPTRAMVIDPKIKELLKATAKKNAPPANVGEDSVWKRGGPVGRSQSDSDEAADSGEMDAFFFEDFDED